MGEPLCNFCEDTAVLYCHDCNMHFCTANGCDEQIHAGKRHKKEGLQGPSSAAVPLEEEAPVCEFCDLSSSEVYCEDCCMYLCTANGCLASVHKNAIGHEITSLLVEDGEYDYVDEEQEGPSDLQSQSRGSDVTSQEGGTADIEPELSQLSIHSGGAQEDKAEKPEKAPEKASEKTPEKLPAKTVEKVPGRSAVKVEPPKSTPSKSTASSDLPRSLTSPLTAKTSSVRLASKGSASAAPAAAPPRTKTAATQIVSNVVKRLVAPIKGTSTTEERLKRREALLAARAEPKLPFNTFGTKFAPEDSKGRRKPSLSFLKQPEPRGSSSKPPIPRAPSPVKPSKELPKKELPKKEMPKPSPTKPRKEDAVTGTTTRSPSKANTRTLPASWSVTDKNASPAAALPSSLFSPSSALPSPTASSARGPRGSLSGPAAPTSVTSPPARAAPRRSSTIQTPAAAADTFEYPAGLAPLGLKYANAPDVGVIVRGVTPGEAGDRSGIQLGDTVKLLNRKAVRNVEEFHSILADCKPATPYKIAVVRNDKSVDLKLTL